MGQIAINIIKELSKYKNIQIGLNILNKPEVNTEDYSIEVKNAIQIGFQEDSINIFFSYPDCYNQAKSKINIGFTGYDSTMGYKTSCLISPEESCNKMDYMITPSEFSKINMINCGITVPIFVFPHGFDQNLFQPKKRFMKTPFIFTQIGEITKRKGSIITIEAFKELYKNNKDFLLVMRANNHMAWLDNEIVNKLTKDIENIKIIFKDEGQDEIINYYNSSNCILYPSASDWYGLIPLESIASGCPVIATKTNGYWDYLNKMIEGISFSMEEIGENHPYLLGKWAIANKDDLKNRMIKIYKNYDFFAESAYNNSKIIREEFSWEKVTTRYLLPFLEQIHDKHFKENRKVHEPMSINDKRVTVAIPTKDRLLELSLLLQSFLFQTYQNFDVLVIDDSLPNLLQNNTTIQSLFKLLINSGHEVTILKGERKGPHIAGQKILENSKNELILRLDDDVSLRPSFIEELVNSFTDDNVGAVGPIYLNPHEPIKGQVIDPKIHPKDFMKQQGKVFWDDNNQLFLTGWLQVNLHPTEDLLEVEHLNSGFMYRKSAGLKINGYCLDFSPVGHREESDFSYRLFREGYKLLVNPKAIALHFHPLSGGIRETDGIMIAKSNWDHDEKIFLDRLEKILPKNKSNDLVSVIILTHGEDHKNVRELLTGINLYTNHNCEYIIVNNDTPEEPLFDVMKIRDEFPKLDIQVITPLEEVSVSEARNEGVKYTNPNSKYICFIDDDARILGRYNQVTDWIDYLYNRFHEQPDVGAVGPILTWFDELKSYVLSVSCLFTSKKVWDLVGGFDPVFGNNKKQTWGYEDVEWSYRVFLRGFKLLGVRGTEFPFYHEDTSFKQKTPEREKALLKGYDLLISKYNTNEIQKYNRTVYPFTKDQMDVNGIKLNIGSYYMYIDGFINIDIKDNIGADLICDVRNLNSHFQPNTVDMILSSHNLEHVTKEDGLKVLNIFHQILKDKGILILEVPDCENLDEKLKDGNIDKDLYNTCKHGCPSEFGQKHEMEYTRESLKKLLEESGFKSIVEKHETSVGPNFNKGSYAFRYDCVK